MSSDFNQWLCRWQNSPERIAKILLMETLEAEHSILSSPIENAKQKEKKKKKSRNALLYYCLVWYYEPKEL